MNTPDPHFDSFSMQHYITLGIFIFICVCVMRIGLLVNDKIKFWIGYSIASASFAVLILDLIFRWIHHSFNVLSDLPIFLCDLVALILPFIIFSHNRKWIGILYFWSLGGTLQALLTPELHSGFPSFEFFRYFIMHGGIVMAVIYYVVVWKIKITWSDLWNAIVYFQVYLVCVHLFNIILGSNYSYTMAKPVNATILNALGQWPWYILWAEILMILLFIILMVPFLMVRNNMNVTATSE